MNTPEVQKPEEEPAKITLTPNEKQKALLQARLVLSKLGTMEERRVCSSSLRRMVRELAK